MPYKLKTFVRKVMKTRKLRGRKRGVASPAKQSYVNMWHIQKILPSRLKNRLKYTEVIPITNVAGAYSEYVYRMNSLFDPNFTGVGAQPTGFDQFATFYNTYRVCASSCRIRYLSQAPLAGSDVSTGCLVLYPSDTSAGVVTYADAISTDYSKDTNFGFYAGNTGSDRLYTKMSIATIAGTTESTVMSEDNFASAVTTSPVNQYYWIIGINNTSVSTMDIEVQVEIEFWVEWTQKLMLNQS